MVRALTGMVSDDLEIRLRFPMRTTDGWRVIEAVLDTGYSERLTLPPALAEGLGVEDVTEVELADGTQRYVNVVRAKIDWMGTEVAVRALVTGSVPLIGVRLLQGYRLEVDFVPEGRVAVTPLNASQ